MKVKIKKFKRLENLTIYIPSKISGGNGVGKTTILEAISFVLTGKDLSGSEFKEIYDNRVELKNAVADVSFFDDFGNEWSRVVSPVFQINRQGVEELKIKRSTVCEKNGIAINDYSNDFKDFAKFGTDFFFNQKEDDQRRIFIDTLKNQMPDFDVNASQLKLKELKKAQKTAQNEIVMLNKFEKEIKDVEVDEINSNLVELNEKYLALSSVDNSKVTEITARNNKKRNEFFELRSRKVGEYSRLKTNNLSNINEIERLEEELSHVKNRTFEPVELRSSELLETELSYRENELSKNPKYESLEDFAKVAIPNNPILLGNVKKIGQIKAGEIELDTKCPCCGIESEKSKTDAMNMAVAKIKSENREILEREFGTLNRSRSVILDGMDSIKSSISEIQQRNIEIQRLNEMNKSKFEAEKGERLWKIEKRLTELKESTKSNNDEIDKLNAEIEGMQEPKLELLPTETEISEELKTAHAEFEDAEETILGQKAININNQKLRAEISAKIKETQVNLIEIDSEIVNLQGAISDYFSNLKGVVKREFAGEIEIDVELLEYVITKDDYKDCFKITANGKKFPYECNGALQNNVKLQILSTFQRLIGYTGITILDNIEANTTEKINTCDLKVVMAGATFDGKINIEKFSNN